MPVNTFGSKKYGGVGAAARMSSGMAHSESISPHRLLALPSSAMAVASRFFCSVRARERGRLIV
jgi:hypothetical protein